MNSLLLDNLTRLVRPISNRVANLVGRAVLRTLSDTKNLQLVQVDLLDGETRDEVERFQNYGFTGVPEQGAEAVVLFVGGRRDHGLAIAVDDRRYRFKNLEPGEVAVYNRFGASIVLKANGEIEVKPKPGEAVRIVGPVNVEGSITATGNIDSDGTVTGDVDVMGGGKSLKTHTHPVAGSNGSGPVVFVPPASTGAPT